MDLVKESEKNEGSRMTLKFGLGDRVDTGFIC
jgi:hypothetical protein